jgi:hypothetical protein
MDIYGKIKERIRNIAGRGSKGTPEIFTAQVAVVSGETCTVMLDELPVTEVRLRAVVNGRSEKLLVTPKVGSYVLVADLSGGEYRDLAMRLKELEWIRTKEAKKN